MSKILEKSWRLLQQEITFKQLAVWATAFRHNYETSFFSRTWWNIVLSQTFFVFVMVLVFWLMLYYTKSTLLTTFILLLQESLTNKTFDPEAIETAVREIDSANYVILGGAILMSVCVGIIAASITLKPAQEAFYRQKRFIGAIAHELRTPLAVLRTQNEVALYDVEKNTQLYETLQENIEQTKRLTQILNNLLLFNRIETTEAIQFEAVNLTPILESVKERLEKLATKRRVIVSIHATPLPDIYANSTAVEQAIYNLVKNAIIYTKPTGGQVTISTNHENSEYAVLTITDNGVGISKKKLKHIFEPFYRADEDNRSTKGTGLGLALVFEIMKLHKGTISVLSDEGVGTTMNLKFPFTLQSINPAEDFKDSAMNFDFKS